MIRTIRIKNCATYSSTGAVIENCKKVNFFYGPNGSGKSTIGKFLQNPTDEHYSQCEIEMDGGSTPDVIVYNREFRERNFQENMAGVFTLGEATIEDIQALEMMKEQRKKQEEDCATRGKTLQTTIDNIKRTSDAFKDSAWDKILKPNEAEFQEAFSGFRGSKERFYEEVIRRFNLSHSSGNNREILLSRAKTLFSKKPEKCSSIVFPNQLIDPIARIESSHIWTKIVVGNKDLPIGGLIEHLGNADWVNQGRMYIEDGDICPFCQKHTMTDDLKKQLDAFFCGEYEKDVRLIKSHIDQYCSQTDDLLRWLHVFRENLNLYSASGIDSGKLDSIIELLTGYFSKNKAEMLAKKNEPSRKVILTDTSITIDSLQELFRVGNDSINHHNKMVENYASEKDVLVADIWSFLMNENEILINSYLDKINDLHKAERGIQRGIEDCNRGLNELKQKIVDAEKNITSVQPAVNEINRSLMNYGFTNFKIVPSATQPNAYQIQRMDGTLASNTLSEGEETFISFLYFLQFAKGSVDVSKISNRKILVLDDPICSLDSTVLYIVSSLVKCLIKDVRDGNSDVEQIFILTHNVFFHKETAFIDRRTCICNDISYWIINKDNNITTIKAYGEHNPIKTSYELLWHELKTNTNASLVTTQNIMRRILETYFNILGKAKDDTIIDSFPTLEEKMICRSLFSWINDGSHSIPDDLYIDSYTDSIERYKQVFRAVFDKMGHLSHFEMMMN